MLSFWPFLVVIWSSSTQLLSGYNLRPSVLSHGLVSRALPCRLRSAHIAHLLPQIYEDKQSDLLMQAAPLEKINDTETSTPSPLNLKVIIPVVTVLAAAAAVVASGKFGSFDFTQVIEESVSKIENMGPYGYLYFAAVRLKSCKYSQYFIC